jgi:hypothetical protein
MTSLNTETVLIIRIALSNGKPTLIDVWNWSSRNKNHKHSYSSKFLEHVHAVSSAFNHKTPLILTKFSNIATSQNIMVENVQVLSYCRLDGDRRIDVGIKPLSQIFTNGECKWIINEILWPKCYVQLQYKQDTDIHTIKAIDSHTKSLPFY